MPSKLEQIGPLNYCLRRSERAKRTRIIVKSDKIEVVAPLQVPEHRIKAFVEAQQDWIKAAILRLANQSQSTPALAPAVYTDGALVPYQGRQLPLQLKQTSAKTLRIQLLPESILIYLPAHSDQQQNSALIKQALVRWMKNRARQLAHSHINKHAPRYSLFPAGLRIKTQKSRWGSCGPKNDINLNWLLILAPPAMLEYVIVHELCHIRHKNHSADFWGLVAEHLPDYPQQRLWLKKHGASLMKGL